MKTININEYDQSLGPLIDIEPKEVYNQKHISGAINIESSLLLYNRQKLLDKNKTYYIYCQGGRKSRRVVNILDAYGYNVVQVLLNN